MKEPQVFHLHVEKNLKTSQSPLDIMYFAISLMMKKCQFALWKLVLMDFLNLNHFKVVS